MDPQSANSPDRTERNFTNPPADRPFGGSARACDCQFVLTEQVSTIRLDPGLGDVQLQEMSRLLLLLSAHRSQQARRRTVGQTFSPHLSASQGEVYGGAVGCKVFHAPQERPHLRRRVPL